MLRLLALATAGLALFAPVAAAHGADTGEPREWWLEWSFSPLQFAPLVLFALFYAERVRRLGGRVPAWRVWSFGLGVTIALLAIVSPIDHIGERDLFWVHMLQHVLLGDIVAVLLVMGITGPVIQPLLKSRFLLRARLITHPAIALPLWSANLFLWHVPALYELSLRNEYVHTLEHVSFVAFGMAMWSPVLETLPAPVWFGTGAKLIYVSAVRAVTAVLGNIFWFAGFVFYPAYDVADPRFGISALEDQIHAGSVMMAETTILTGITLIWLFFRMARESDDRQQLIEAGVDRESATRAVRFGRQDALARRHGIELQRGPG
jgi:cytochrome c oxidase assembly factor CtaG